MSFTRYKKPKSTTRSGNRDQRFLEETLQFFKEIGDPIYEFEFVEMGADILRDSHLQIAPRQSIDEDAQLSESFWISRGMAGASTNSIGDVSWL